MANGIELTMDAETRALGEANAARLGISFSAYVRALIRLGHVQITWETPMSEIRGKFREFKLEEEEQMRLRR